MKRIKFIIFSMLLYFFISIVTITPANAQTTGDSFTPYNRNIIKTNVEELSDLQPIDATIDFSEATIYDEYGNVLENETNLARSTNSVSFNEISLFGIGGGNWSSGSGFRLVKGAKVSGRTTDGSNLDVSFYCDFTLVQSGYDTLDRVYGVQANGSGSVAYLSTGVLRRKETVEYSAYGGVRLQHHYSGYGGNNPRTTTYWLYVRVGGDRYWLDSNLRL